MGIKTATGFVGFLLSLSVLNAAAASAKTSSNLADPSTATIEQRLSRLSTAIKTQQEQLPEFEQTQLPDNLVAIGWGDGNGRDWVNGRRGGGWGDGHRGDWVNGARWRDGGSFYNRY